MIEGHNFIYEGVSVDTQMMYSCEESGCDEEGICRCGIIINPSIQQVNLNKISNIIYDLYFDRSISTYRNNKINSILYGITEEIERYTIDRILRVNKIWNPINWEIHICGGYYGQEVEEVVIENKISLKIEDQIKECLNMNSLSERIEYILNLEYGKVLPELSNCSYELTNIDRDDIVFGSNSHFNNIITEDLEHYSDKNYRGIRGIVKPIGDKFRLIDGYHRCYKTENKFVKVLKVKK